MVEEPDRLRQDIESTRASLTRDVDMLAEKTSPKKVAQRRWTAVKDKVMGSSEHARHAATDTAGTVHDRASSAAGMMQDKASSAAGTVQDKAASAAGTVQEKAAQVGDSVRQAPHTVARQAQGNPLAAGIIAFGVGLLAAALIPVSDAERQAGQQLKEHSGDLTDKVKDVAGDLGADLKGDVRQAAGEVRQTAQDAVQTTKSQAQSSAQDATQQTRDAAQSVR